MIRISVFQYHNDINIDLRNITISLNTGILLTLVYCKALMAFFSQMYVSYVQFSNNTELHHTGSDYSQL